MKNVFRRLKEELFKTSRDLTSKIDDVINPETSREVQLEMLEEAIITSDLGVKASIEIVDSLRNTPWTRKPDELRNRLKEAIYNILKDCQKPIEINSKPFVIMVLGVNGVGKTTTIGKLASRYVSYGKKVILAAGDTFRAAAIEQLMV
ncbi:MAG: signal recognition particle receptor subunit alpha, partial [Thermodesulfobacteriota bacterium]